MNRIPCTANPEQLLDEVARIPVVRISDGSGSASADSLAGWIHQFSNTRLMGPGYPNRMSLYPAIGNAIRELAATEHHTRLTQVMVNVVHSGGKLAVHRDGEPDAYRYHLPLVTHSEITWWDELEGSRHMELGFWYGPVPFCGILHSVNNPSTVDRIHLVADFWRE